MAKETRSESRREGSSFLFNKHSVLAGISVLLGYLLKSIADLQAKTAFSLSLFICVIVSYWIPPKYNISFPVWLFIAAGVALPLYFIMGLL